MGAALEVPRRIGAPGSGVDSGRTPQDSPYCAPQAVYGTATNGFLKLIRDQVLFRSEEGVVDVVATGRFIAAMRQASGLTQERLAEKLNVTHQAVSKWENGSSLPDAGLLVALAEELGVSIEEILRGVRRRGERMAGRVPTHWTTIRAADGYYPGVYRDGHVIHKDASTWTPAVHALLRYLESRQFPAPRVAGSGFDDQGRQTVSVVEGKVDDMGLWSLDAAHKVGALLRRLHDETRNFEPSAEVVWFPWYGRDVGSGVTVIGHCDLGPWNIVQRAGLPVAFIDWDFAGPVDPIWELAHVSWLNAHLHDDIVAEIEGLPPVEERATRLRAIVEGYGLPARERAGLVQKCIEIAIMETAAEGDMAGIGPDTRPAALAQPVPWALAWRARAAVWMIRNRSVLEQALR